jgi:acyl dehydratase
MATPRRSSTAYRCWRSRRPARPRSRSTSATFIAFTSASCKFLAEVHAGDTLYPQLEITDLAPHGDAGQVTTRATIHNQHGELVLDGEHTYLLKTAQQSTSEATS